LFARKKSPSGKWTLCVLSIPLGIAIPNRSGSEPTDVKKPVRYANKKKQKQFQDKNEDTTTEVKSEETGKITYNSSDES
jgi:hypothetical protein